jgi:hypothetical protein
MLRRKGLFSQAVRMRGGSRRTARPAPEAGDVHAVHVDGHDKWRGARSSGAHYASQNSRTARLPTRVTAVDRSPRITSSDQRLNRRSARHVRAGGERSRAHTVRSDHRARRPSVWDGRMRRLRRVVTMVRGRRPCRRGAGSSQVTRGTGPLDGLRRIHSASTIAAASIIAGHTGAAAIVTRHHLPTSAVGRVGTPARAMEKSASSR